MLDACEFERACVCQALRHAARKVTKRYGAALSEHALTVGQFTILAALNQEKPVPLGAIARALGMDRTTLTQDLKPLERRQLVQSVINPDDARVRCLQLTEKGLERLREGFSAWEDAQSTTHRQISDAEWRQLRSILDKLSQ